MSYHGPAKDEHQAKTNQWKLFVKVFIESEAWSTMIVQKQETISINLDYLILQEEVNDESLRLSEIRPIGKFLKVHERKMVEKHKTVDRQITTLLGSRSEYTAQV